MSDTTLQQVGGQGGSAFSFTGENFTSLDKIGVWLGGWQVKAVNVWLSDGRSQKFGRPNGPYQEFQFQPDECFTSLSLWGNKDGRRLGAIKFKTTLGREFFAKMTSQSLGKEYTIDICTGYCLGVEGRACADIDSMGFVFLKAVESAVLTDVHYPTLHQLIPQVALEEIKSLTYTNSSSTPQKQKVESSKKVIKSSSWSMSNNFKAALSVEVKAGIPMIAEDASEFSVTIGNESTYGQENTEESTETLTTDLQVPPGKKLDVCITIRRYNFDLPYTGTVNMTLANGRVLQYGTKGTYKGITYSDVKVNTKESLL